jgi:c(7)-type cytochrome triheme protein
MGMWNEHKQVSGSKGMINRHDSVILLIAVILFLAVSGVMAQPDNITLNHPEIFMKRERPPVAFPHTRHIEAEISCKDCHHQYEKGENVLDESTLQEGNQEIKCSACHPPRSRLDLQRAFHYQCLSCHKKNERERKKTGPRFCGECHLWK